MNATYATLFLVVFFITIIIPTIIHQKNERKRKNIYSIIIRNDETPIDEISSAIQWEYIKIEKTLQKMINHANDHKIGGDYKLLRNAYIDLQRKRIVLSPDRYNTRLAGILSKKQVMKKDINDPDIQQNKAVICNFCGEKTKAADAAKCENCGAPLP